ncbi:MAG: hypothetical protein GX763_07045 [Clostridiaceae bacterium]|nr:hypothetical protein [Clostridiaceae bacterium]
MKRLITLLLLTVLLIVGCSPPTLEYTEGEVARLRGSNVITKQTYDAEVIVNDMEFTGDELILEFTVINFNYDSFPMEDLVFYIDGNNKAEVDVNIEPLEPIQHTQGTAHFTKGLTKGMHKIDVGVLVFGVEDYFTFTIKP